jgi:hypothetical protein
MFWYGTPKRSDSDELTSCIGIHYGDIACCAGIVRIQHSEWIRITQLRFALIELFSAATKAACASCSMASSRICRAALCSKLANYQSNQ